MDVAKSLDDLWVGVKCQTYLVIAGSPRNIFRYRLPADNTPGGRALNGTRAKSVLVSIKLRIPGSVVGGLRRAGLSWCVERETAQTPS